MLARCSSAYRAVGPSLPSRRFAASWIHDDEFMPTNLRAKRGRPRTYDGTALPVHPENAPLVRLLRQSEPLKGTSEAQHTYAVNTVACYPKPIASLDDVKLLRVGETYKKQIALYVRERTRTGADPATAFRTSLKSINKDKSLEETLNKLPYYSPALCKRLLSAGCDSLKDLRDSAEVRKCMTPRQRGVAAWAEQILQPVTSEEAQRLVDFLNEYFQPSGWTVHITGNLRRGASETSEVELLLFHRTFGYIPLPTEDQRKTRHHDLERLLDNSLWRPLRDRGVMADSFQNKFIEWEGMLRVPDREGDRWERQLDCKTALGKREGRYIFARIRALSTKSAGAALLRTTGDAEYVKHLAWTAFGLGLHFDDFGLWQFHPNDPAEVLNRAGLPKKCSDRLPPKLPQLLTNGYWELLPSDTEEAVLEPLDLPYIAPVRRNFANISPKRGRKPSSTL